MSQSVYVIRAGINCVFVKGEAGSLLIDTGPRNARKNLLRGLEAAGHRAGSRLTLLLTHGDTDHTGSVDVLREEHHAHLACHKAESPVLAGGDMTRNRKDRPDRMPWYFRALLPLGFLFGRGPRIGPDTELEDGQSLQAFGVEGTVYHLPGHSRGSLGVLLPTGELACGDLFWNTRRPRLHPLIDDLDQARASIQRIRQLPVRTIIPAHGRPFPAELIPSS